MPLKRTATESYLLRLRRHPVGHRCRPDGVPEPHHTGERYPTVLAEPAVRAASTGACSRTAVRCTSVRVGESGIAGQDGRGSKGMCEGEYGGGDVGVGWGVVVQRVAVLYPICEHSVRGMFHKVMAYPFGIVVRNKDIGLIASDPSCKEYFQ